MDKLLKEYEQECVIYSKKASLIWKIGLVIISIMYIKMSYERHNYIEMFILSMVLVLILYFVCLFIFKKAALKKIYCNDKSKIKAKKFKELFNEINKYQKNWITVYCKKNKINQISKLEILKNSLREERKGKTISYINPLIIGTLTFTIWEIGLQKLSEKIGFMNTTFVAIAAAIVISIIIGIFKKEFIENKEFVLEFDKYSSNKRLEKLLLYEILKTKK